MTVKDGKLVSFEYTLKNDEGEKIESNVGEEPLKYIHGNGQIVPGLERALEGMEEGDSKKVEVSPEEGYGEVDNKHFVEVPKERVPEEAHKVGAQLQTKTQDGQAMHARVSEIKGESLVLDFNHPLAGQTLNFDIKIVEVASPGA